MMSRRSFKIAMIFSILVFFILTLTMFLTALLVMLPFQLGMVAAPNRPAFFVVFAAVSIITGTVISKVIGKRPIAVITAMSNATKEVAKGNFEVRLNEDIRVEEIHTMAHNFNVMARELSNTEMFRNDFIENVSHEFKTPISAIEGYATLLQNQALSEKKRLEYTRKILNNTRRLSALAGNILLLSRLEHQEIDIKKEWFILDEQLREVILLCEEIWSAKEIELDIVLDDAEYFGNRELLFQVWQNILSNAVKFVSQKGRIQICLLNEAEVISISIADNGIGMNEKTMERIYEKFYQGETSRATSGNGLGLTLAKRIICLHGGKITADSQEGKGTVFTVILPKKGERS